MALGHFVLAIENDIAFFLALAFIVVGNGFFKPNMTSIISKMYEGHDEKKDGAYNIFYMGVNAGAFIGIMLCGWIGEKIGWSYGFGLAMIFMIAGAIQFWLSGKLFGYIGLKRNGNFLIESSKRSPLNLGHRLPDPWFQNFDSTSLPFASMNRSYLKLSIFNQHINIYRAFPRVGTRNLCG